MDAASLFFKKIKEKLGYMIKGIYFCRHKYKNNNKSFSEHNMRRNNLHNNWWRHFLTQ